MNSAIDWIATKLRERRDALARLGAQVDGARLLDEVLADIEQATRDHGHKLLKLREAAAFSGYSADHLGRLVKTGHLCNYGRKWAPLIAEADLPRKPGTRAVLTNGVMSGVLTATHETASVKARIAREVARTRPRRAR